MGGDTHALQGLSFVEDILLEITPLPRQPEAPALARLNGQNQQTLIADASLEESHRVHDPAAEDAALAADLQRLEFKINVLLQLVVRLAHGSQSLPPAQTVRLFAGGMEWRAAATDPAPGSIARVRLHINPAVPLPLEFVGVMAMPRRNGDETWSRFVWQGLSPAVVDLIEKLIFRHHRRQIAVAKASVPAGSTS